MTSSDQLDGVSAHTGFPNPALDQSLESLDFNKLLIKHPASTYFMRIEGNDWERIGILSGDIAIIDRIINPSPIDLVIWWQEDSFMISPRHKITGSYQIWGVVTSVIHRYRD